MSRQCEKCGADSLPGGLASYLHRQACGRGGAAEGFEEFEIVAADEDTHNRTELHRYPDRWEMVWLRHRVGGGWYVKNSLVCKVSSDA